VFVDDGDSLENFMGYVQGISWGFGVRIDIKMVEIEVEVIADFVRHPRRGVFRKIWRTAQRFEEEIQKKKEAGNPEGARKGNNH